LLTYSLDKEFRILENEFGFFLQRYFKKDRKYHSGSVKTKWRTQGRFSSLEEAMLAYEKLTVLE